MLQNEYLVAKIGGDTAENEPLQNLTLFIHLFIRVLNVYATHSQGPVNTIVTSHLQRKTVIDGSDRTFE